MTAGEPDQPFTPSQPMFGFPAPAAQWTALFEGPHNAAALRLAKRPEDWAMPVLCITGPAKSGLSFLAEAWVSQFGGAFLSAAHLGRAARRALDEYGSAHVAIDDADIAAYRHEEALLTLINIIGAGGGRLLLTSHRAPSQWRTGSADLRSRLNALPVGEISGPDEDVLRARLSIAAERRFLKLAPETLTYLVPRLELAYEAVEDFMDRLSASVSDADRAPSLPLARSVLDAMREPDGDDEG